LADHYESLTHAQLVNLLRKRDSEKKLGLVWERKEIEADAATDANFIACTLDTDLSDGSAPWPNLVIEGDNFDALRWLRMTYARRVKCIYIDPPYNTGNKDWVYNDHYVDANDRYRHSTWLEFLFRRLELARDLLTSDGVILVSINDDNRAKLELLLDEVLPGMRIGSLVWRTRDTTSAKGRNFSDVHEHILVYGNEKFEFNGSAKSRAKYKNPDKDPRGDWNIDPLTLAFDHIDRPNLFYPLCNPETNVWYPCDHDRVWCFASKKRLKDGQTTRSLPMEDQIAAKLIVFPASERVVVWNSVDEVKAAILSNDVPVTPRDKKPLLKLEDDLVFWVGKKVGFGRPGMKKFWTDLKSHIAPLGSWIARLNEAGDDELTLARTGSGGEGTNEIQAIFGRKAFQNPKPVRLLRQLIEQSSNDGDVVLDFFAGSATTAQAVMEINAEEAGSRRFIMVSSTEASSNEPDNNICREVTAERLRRLNALNTGKYADMSAAFAYLRTREIDFDALNTDLAPAEAWNALEAMHDLPLTPYNEARGWDEHVGDGLTLILADRTEESMIARLRELAAARANVFVYSWAPGQVRNVLGPVDFDVLPVRETLVKRFTA
jgi:adenine-specific DNA-methyltransferase